MNKFIRVFISNSPTYVDVPLSEGETFAGRLAQARLEGAICSPTIFVPYANIHWAAELTATPVVQGVKH